MALVGTNENRRGRGRGQRLNISDRGPAIWVISRFAEDQRTICKEQGHWKRECPQAGGLHPVMV